MFLVFFAAFYFASGADSYFAMSGPIGLVNRISEVEEEPLRNEELIFNETVLVGTRGQKLVWDPLYHIYRLDGKPVIWAYWDEDEMPAVIQLSRATVLCHNELDFHLQVIHDSDIATWIDHIHPAFKFLSGNHKGDYFRARILGSIWFIF